MSLKRRLIFLLLLVGFNSFYGCFPVKSVPDVRGFNVVQGDENSKNELERLNKFTFQIYSSPIVFNRYLDDRYKNEKGFNPNNFRLKVEGVWFNFSVLGEADTSKYIDFTDYIFKNDDPELVKSGKTKYFIAITVTTDEHKDCLKMDSFYRYVISDYLNDIRMGFKAY
ncbi:hypothetical protein [Bizionia arctica]|uniref:hypothetical protein n=1 Tax=Bizionia arctica TaxID=1495645 RepID=UPI001667758E|nr:hypothetical protein [Bizionia arctica]